MLVEKFKQRPSCPCLGGASVDLMDDNLLRKKDKCDSNLGSTIGGDL